MANYRLQTTVVPLVFFSSFYSLQTSLSLHCCSSLCCQCYKRHWELGGCQSLISSRQEHSRYLTANSLFWQVIQFFLYFNFSLCNARSSCFMLVQIIQIIIIQITKIQRMPKESRYSIFLSPAFEQSPLPDVLQLTAASLVIHIFNS